MEKAVQTGVECKHVQEVAEEVHETSFPEDEKWAMLSKYDNLSRNEFLLREYVTDLDPLKQSRDCNIHMLIFFRSSPTEFSVSMTTEKSARALSFYIVLFIGPIRILSLWNCAKALAPKFSCLLEISQLDFIPSYLTLTVCTRCSAEFFLSFTRLNLL